MNASNSLVGIVDAIYVVISAAGFLSNSIAILVFFREETLRRQFNIILLNVFLADIMLSLTIQTYIWIDLKQINPTGKIGGFLCAVSVGLIVPWMCLASNAISLFAITLLRYPSIVRNYRGFFVTSVNFIKGFCVCTWLIGIFQTIFGALSFRYNHTESVCYREWPKGTDGSLYSSITTSIYLLGLLLCMIICYGAVAVHVGDLSSRVFDISCNGLLEPVVCNISN